MNKSLKDVLVRDAAKAVKREASGNFEVLPAGNYNFKLLGFTEEETYNAITFEYQNKKYNFFYNLFQKNSDQLDLDTLNWFKGLATIPIKDDTTLLEIANSAINCTYNVKIYNYVSKSGKNAGKKQMAIDFTFTPTLATADVTTEEMDLPY